MLRPSYNLNQNFRWVKIEELAADPEEKFEEYLVDDFDPSLFDDSALFRRRKGEMRDLLRLDLRQSYDFELEGTGTNALSDLDTDLSFYPNRNFGFRVGSNLGVEEFDLNSWYLSSSIQDDRGDTLRTRVTYVENSVAQVDGNIEFVVNDRLRLGYYGKFDEREGEFIEHRGAVRVMSGCARCCRPAKYPPSNPTPPEMRPLRIAGPEVALYPFSKRSYLPIRRAPHHRSHRHPSSHRACFRAP